MTYRMDPHPVPAMVVLDPGTPRWQRLAGLADPPRENGWTVSTTAFAVIFALMFSLVMLVGDRPVAAVVLLVLAAAGCAHGTARRVVSGRCGIVVTSPEHIDDLQMIVEASPSQQRARNLWHAARSHAHARQMADRLTS